MQKTIKRIATAIGEDPLIAGPVTRAMIQTHVNAKVAKGRRKVTVTQSQREALVRARWVYHVERSAQAWLAIASALFLDSGQLTDSLLTDATAVKLVRFLAILDVHHLLLKWVKENTVLLSAQLLEQAPEMTNVQSVHDLWLKISEIAEIGRPPKEGCLGYGRVRERCDTLRQMSLRTQKSQSFRMRLYAVGQNILYIKRGMPAAHEEDIEAALMEHRATLSTKRGSSPDAERDREVIMEALEDLAAEVFGGATFEPVEQCPSTNAGFGAPRGKGGAFQHLASLGGLVKLRPLVQAVLSLSQLCYMHEVRPGVVVEVLRLPGREELLRQVGELISAEALAELGVGTDLEVLEAREQVAFDLGYDLDVNPVDGYIDAEPAAIVEPCKCRIITKGRPAAYHRGLSLQKFLHGTMRRVDVFQYIGHPIRLSNWTMPAELDEGQFYVSGDYKGATDNLDPSLCIAAWRAISRVARCEGLPLALHPLWARLGEALLVRHRLHYRRVCSSPEAQAPVQQAWGQLMGSPVSFPILNLINAAATAVGTGWGSDSTAPHVSVLAHLRSIHCVTNGDDVAFVTDAAHYETWQRVVTSAGLAPSLGKNYISPYFCIMNSEMRCPVRTAGPSRPILGFVASHEVVNPEGELCGFELVDSPPRVWRDVRFLNLPILFGIESKGLEAGKPVSDRLCWWELRGLALSLVADCPPEVLDRRMSFFNEFYAPVLGRVPVGVNYYIPPTLGGLGLPRRLDKPWSVPEATRKRSGYLACLDTIKRFEAVLPPSDVWTWGNFKRLRSRGPVATTKTLVEPEMSELETVENQWMVEAGILPNLNRPVGSNPLDAFSEHCWAAFIDGASYEHGRAPKDPDTGETPDPAVEAVRTRELRERKMAQRIFRQNARSKASSCKPVGDETLCTWAETKVLSIRELYPTLRIRIESAKPDKLRQACSESLDLHAGDRSDPWLSEDSQEWLHRDATFSETAVRRALRHLLGRQVFYQEFDDEGVVGEHREQMLALDLLRGLTTHADPTPISSNAILPATGEGGISSRFQVIPEDPLERSELHRETPNNYHRPVCREGPFEGTWVRLDRESRSKLLQPLRALEVSF